MLKPKLIIVLPTVDADRTIEKSSHVDSFLWAIMFKVHRRYHPTVPFDSYAIQNSLPTAICRYDLGRGEDNIFYYEVSCWGITPPFISALDWASRIGWCNYHFVVANEKETDECYVDAKYFGFGDWDFEKDAQGKVRYSEEEADTATMKFRWDLSAMEHLDFGYFEELKEINLCGL